MGGKKKKGRKGKKKKKGYRMNSSPSRVFYNSDDEPDALFICDHLKFENAYEKHEIQSEIYHRHFTCGICSNIVLNPKQCS